MCLCHLINSWTFIIFRSWASGCWILLSSGDFVQLTITWMKVVVLISWTKICVIVPKVCFLLLFLNTLKHQWGMCPSTVHKNRCSHDCCTEFMHNDHLTGLHPKCASSRGHICRFRGSSVTPDGPWAEWRFTLVAIKRTHLITRCPLGRYFVSRHKFLFYAKFVA